MSLPIANYKNEIMSAVMSHPFTVISAEAGAGKSTQVPQYLSEHYDKVVTTEPRIMAAKTLAMRVAEEMGINLGEEVGYNTAYDKCFSQNSNIVYCTDGVQLVKKVFERANKTEDVLLIDEVHEYNLNTEILLALCKHMNKKWNTKVGLMSATINTEELANFFGKETAVLDIPGTLYDVEVEERPRYTLISTIRENIDAGNNILVFVAGKKDIQNVMAELKDKNAEVLPLHGELEWAEQKKCFDMYQKPKVVVATNIAQTSLTIPDIDVVVDTGKAKISMAKNGVQEIVLVDVSQAEIMQRMRRAGRTKNGKYILCSNIGIKERPEYTIPEIQRSILDRVVLQVAEFGLDAEELEFLHQPDKEAIVAAKRELTALGAFADNKITELGRKMVKIPVNVQLARMIVEAEKYGVTEQVITIAAICEIGGLLSKEGRYSHFTHEYESDLLAELDVWEAITKLKYIEFDKLGINKKNFFLIKDLIKKIKETVYGTIEITHNDDRKAILKSCLCGLVSHIYVQDYDVYRNNERKGLRLSKRSCVSEYSKIVIGTPKPIEFIDDYGYKRNMMLITFASEIGIRTLMELVPNAIEEEVKLQYVRYMDAVEITTVKRFAGVAIKTEVDYDRQHPKYEELKAEYEKNFNSVYSDDRQNEVVIDGKIFRVTHWWDGTVRIALDNATLYSTEQKEILLDSGKKVTVCVGEHQSTSIPALRNVVEAERINMIRKSKKWELEQIRIRNVLDVISHSNQIGKIELTKENGGYGNTPICAYIYIVFNKDGAVLKIGDDEEIANSKNSEALEKLFLQEVEKKYGERKFSRQGGKKKKTLTESEMEAKKDFDSLVRETMHNLTIENAKESLAFLEEYYQELMQ